MKGKYYERSVKLDMADYDGCVDPVDGKVYLIKKKEEDRSNLGASSKVEVGKGYVSVNLRNKRKFIFPSEGEETFGKDMLNAVEKIRDAEVMSDSELSEAVGFYLTFINEANKNTLKDRNALINGDVLIGGDMIQVAKLEMSTIYTAYLYCMAKKEDGVTFNDAIAICLNNPKKIKEVIEGLFPKEQEVLKGKNPGANFVLVGGVYDAIEKKEIKLLTPSELIERGRTSDRDGFAIIKDPATGEEVLVPITTKGGEAGAEAEITEETHTESEAGRGPVDPSAGRGPVDPPAESDEKKGKGKSSGIKGRILAWVKRHKKGVIAGAITAAIVTIALGVSLGLGLKDRGQDKEQTPDKGVASVIEVNSEIDEILGEEYRYYEIVGNTLNACYYDEETKEFVFVAADLGDDFINNLNSIKAEGAEDLDANTLINLDDLTDIQRYEVKSVIKNLRPDEKFEIARVNGEDVSDDNITVVTGETKYLLNRHTLGNNPFNPNKSSNKNDITIIGTPSVYEAERDQGAKIAHLEVIVCENSDKTDGVTKLIQYNLPLDKQYAIDYEAGKKTEEDLLSEIISSEETERTEAILFQNFKLDEKRITCARKTNLGTVASLLEEVKIGDQKYMISGDLGRFIEVDKEGNKVEYVEAKNLMMNSGSMFDVLENARNAEEDTFGDYNTTLYNAIFKTLGGNLEGNQEDLLYVTSSSARKDGKNTISLDLLLVDRDEDDNIIGVNKLEDAIVIESDEKINSQDALRLYGEQLIGRDNLILNEATISVNSTDNISEVQKESSTAESTEENTGSVAEDHVIRETTVMEKIK